MSKDKSKYEVHVENIGLEDGRGIRTMNIFFKKIIENFAEECFIFYKEWGEFPFVYRERQVNSALIPAIHKYTNTIWLEQPFKKSSKDQRFLDIVTTDKNNIYLIELKHAYISKSDYVTKLIDTEWETALEQIKDVNRKTLGAYYNYKDFNIFKIALMILPKYMSLNDYKNKEDITEFSAKDENKKITEQFSDKYWKKSACANFCGTIKIEDCVKYKHEYENSCEVYPFVSFVIRVEQV